MNVLAYTILLDVSFIDPHGNLIVRETRKAALSGQEVPFVTEGVLLKQRIATGCDYLVACRIDSEEAVNFRSAVPIPEKYQTEIAGMFQQQQETRADLFKDRNSLALSHAPAYEFTADIWGRLYVAASGFAEFEVHVGEEGLGTPKSIMKAQFWTRVRQ